MGAERRSGQYLVKPVGIMAADIRYGELRWLKIGIGNVEFTMLS